MPKKRLKKNKNSKKLIQNSKKENNNGKNFQNNKNFIELKKIHIKHSAYFGLKIAKNKNCKKIH